METRREGTKAAQHPPVVQLLGMIVTEYTVGSGATARGEVPAGILVLGARRESAAVRGGVVTGDIICEVDGVAVGTLRDLENRLAGHDSAFPVRLLIWSGGIWRFLAVPLGETGNADMPSLRLAQLLQMQR